MKNGTVPGVHTCRFCDAELVHTFIDLGASPLANAYLKPDQLDQPERFYPLHAYVCSRCLLVQLPACSAPEAIFSDYAYFSSYSDTWLQHAERYAEMAVKRFGLNPGTQVVEVASNDGYLLQYFLRHGLSILGVEPAANVAAAAVKKGVPTIVKFFGEKTACELRADGIRADLLIGNNVLAHVPDLNDFVRGLAVLLAPRGTITMEFPHLMRLMADNQFDTIYHEHFSYFSFLTVERVFERHGLRVVDVEELPTHGGSLRIYACHAGDERPRVGGRVGELRAREQAAGFARLEHYLSFAENVAKVKRKLLMFLSSAKEQGKTIVGYGAPAKGNTLLNYCGVRTDFLDYTVDRSPHKQRLLLPGTRIPIHDPERIRATKPDFVLILPWNLKDEIIEQLAFIRRWGGRFVVPIPQVTVLA
ncbi:methyltransferase domain-containing protein [Candidatus Nitrospira bockiana]